MKYIVQLKRGVEDESKSWLNVLATVEGLVITAFIERRAYIETDKLEEVKMLLGDDCHIEPHIEHVTCDKVAPNP